MPSINANKPQPGITVIQLDRPPANAYDDALIRELGAALDGIRDDLECKVAIVRGNEKFFSAGADIKWMTARRTAAELMNFVQAGREVLAKIEQLPQVVIAAIAGHAMGGGLELALACDLRFMAAGPGQMAVPEVKISAVPNMCGTQRLPRLIGKSRAFDMLTTGRALGHEEALRLGLVDRVFPPQELMARTLEYASHLVGGATLAITLIKRAVNEGITLSLEAGLDIEREAGNTVFRSEDFAEGTKAFTEKRPPQFRGR